MSPHNTRLLPGRSRRRMAAMPVTPPPPPRTYVLV